MDSATMQYLEELIKQCILRDRPRSFFSATMSFAKLSKKDHELLNQVERTYGATGANQWLCDVMVSTGLFQHDGEGYVKSTIFGKE